MDYRFSDKVLALKPNAIREILKSASDPGVISLSAGNPAPDAFPVDAIREIVFPHPSVSEIIREAAFAVSL